MSTTRFFPTLFLLLGHFAGGFAQNPDGDKQSAQMAKDSAQGPTSELVAQLGFDSRALVAGRDFDVQQNALMPGLTYYHHSGAFVGLNGSLLSNADPKYTQTTLQAGYGHGLGDHFYTSATYQRFFFNPAAEGLLQNAVSLFGNYSLGPFSLGASYTVLFDPEKAQQLNLSLSGFFSKKRLKKLDALSFAPGVSLLAGTETIALQRFSNSVFRQGTGLPWQDRVPRRPPVSGNNVREANTSFGPLSFNLSLPVTLQMGRLGATLSVNYVKPFASEAETTETETLSNTLFFSACCAWTILKKEKK